MFLHLVENLAQFPDENLSRKEIQSFLGIVNYIRDFLPQAAKYTSPLSKMLKKTAPPWGQEQTTAVQRLKELCKKPPPLKIPSTGKRILQTDASDDYWGAVLLEENNTGSREYCGHASGQFSDAEKHYHTIFKEILAVKYGIKKFEFHLIGHKFTVEMDNSSFPGILNFKNFEVPDAQRLRMKDWFSKYDFEVKHIKGNHNILADYLSRPKKNSIKLITPTTSFPLIFMAIRTPARQRRTLPPSSTPLTTAEQIKNFAQSQYLHYESQIPSSYRLTIIPRIFCFRPPYAFLTKPHLFGHSFTESFLWSKHSTLKLLIRPGLVPYIKGYPVFELTLDKDR